MFTVSKLLVSFGTAEDRNVRMSASTLNTEILEVPHSSINHYYFPTYIAGTCLARKNR
jgi:hypothetical protein